MEIITPEEQKIYNELIVNTGDNIYFKNKLRILSKEEVVYLFKLKEQGNKEAFDKLFYHNLRLVNSIIKTYKCEGTTQSDLFQIGCIGLIKAIEKYDYKKDYVFSSYAVISITRTLNKSLINNYQSIRFPLYRYSEIKKIKDAIEKLYIKLEKEPTEEELAEYLQMDLEEIKKLMIVIYYTDSLDKEIEEQNLYEILPNEQAENPENNLL